MNRALFACGEARLPSNTSGFGIAERLDWQGPDRNLEIEGLEQKLIESFDPVSRDFLEIACCVYAADRLVSRGENNLSGADWRRSVRLRMPVRELELWKRLERQLATMLGFLTDDSWNFDFVQARRKTARPVPLYDDPTFRRCTCVVLFSGGLDSLAGAVVDRKQSGHAPLLVSHRSHAVIDRRQRDLVGRLNQVEHGYEHVQFWVHLRDREDRETSQRSRSFLFLTVAVVLARQFNIHPVHVFENGILSINLPLAAQVVGTMASRTTHPRFLDDMESFTELLFGTRVAIELPFLLNTKREVVELLAAHPERNLIPLSSSCAHPYWRSRLNQHCGVCSQCIDRRFAVEAAGLGSLDQTYERDLFTTPIAQMPNEAEARGLIEGYVRTYREIAELDEEAFWLRFPELTRLASHVTGEKLRALYDLYRRQWTDLEQVLSAQVEAHKQEIVLGLLPSDCLLQFILNQVLNRKSQARYADRIADIAERSWRTAFSGRRAPDEAEVQRELDVGLAAAEEHLEREHPMFLFVTGVKAKPDFANGRHRVFVEVKYPRAGSVTVRDVTEDIAADLMKYEDQADIFLFLVYDPDSLVRNPPRFTAELEAKASKAMIRVI
jgi:7-cyano-7-deazaguanine synthase in queuosine biosynthesis